ARPPGPVAPRGLACGAVPVGPSLGGRYRHAIPVSRSAQRPPLINDAPRQTQPPGRSQRSITVRHETSRCSEPSSSYTSPGGLTYVQHPTACHQPPWSVQLEQDMRRFDRIAVLSSPAPALVAALAGTL